jgi:hypothetical protein
MLYIHTSKNTHPSNWVLSIISGDGRRQPSWIWRSHTFKSYFLLLHCIPYQWKHRSRLLHTGIESLTFFHVMTHLQIFGDGVLGKCTPLARIHFKMKILLLHCIPYPWKHRSRHRNWVCNLNIFHVMSYLPILGNGVLGWMYPPGAEYIAIWCTGVVPILLF